MRIQSIGIIFFVVSSAGSSFGQNVPTGIQRVGAVSLLRSESKISLGTGAPIDSTTDNASGAFVSSDYTNYTPPTLPPTTTIGPCIITSIPLPLTQQPPNNVVTTALDAGPVLNVNGPDGAKQIPQMKGFYFLMVGGGIAIPTPFPIPGLPGVLPPYLDPGSYEVDNGGGGADVGSFTATLNVPSPGFLWTNADANLTITLASGVDIQWSGGDPTTNVEIQGASASSTVAGSFTCIVPNNGEFFVTSDVLSLMPATPAGATAAASTLTVSNSSMANFSASGIDTGLLIYEAGQTRNVVYQ